MLDYRQIKNERQWKASTGLNEVQFFLLAKHFKETYEFFKGYRLQDLQERNEVCLLLKTYEEALFFVLFQLKNNLSYDSLGLLIHTDGSNAQRNYEQFLRILEYTLDRQGVMPDRNFASVDEFKACVAQETELILDGSEQATHRPSQTQAQADYYSGKKKDTPTNS